ncbi:MAG: hypothetical protein EOO28_26145 [Comamonadaceae bacterium]|nr:MAG: hypothetical protein EOO28_26145 [Comamonadaceae bacterium]
MYNDDDLRSAVDAGIFSEEAAAAFRHHLAGRTAAAATAPAGSPDEENFRLVTGFNDIFVVIACALLLVAIAWIVAAVSSIGAGLVATSAVSWGLAEFFTRRRHLALPSIFLLLTFAACLFAGSATFLPEGVAGLTVSAAITAAATWFHWRRFRVPISVAAGAGALVGGVIALLVLAIPALENGLPLLMIAAGLAVFALAMRWDSTDTLRQTGRSDVAFWLHLLAAPLIVHPVFTTLGIYGGRGSLAQTATVAVLYLMIALVSLAIDRRALMVSALAYVLYAFSSLFKTFGMVSIGFALTGLAVGSALLLLSAFWQQSRAAVLRYFPESLQSRLPPSR